MAFEMRINDVFRLSNGRTVFSGKVVGYDELVGSCKCLLLKGDERKQEFLLEGEMIIKKTDKNNLYRALATTESVELSAENAKTGEWRLIGN